MTTSKAICNTMSNSPLLCKSILKHLPEWQHVGYEAVTDTVDEQQHPEGLGTILALCLEQLYAGVRQESELLV